MFEIEKERQKERLRCASPAVNTSRPQSSAYRRPIQPPPVTQRDREIARANTVFLARLRRIRGGPSQIDHHPPYAMYDRNRFLKEQERRHNQLEAENAVMLNRLCQTVTYYPTKRAEESFAKNRIIFERIRRYEDTDEDMEEDEYD